MLKITKLNSKTSNNNIRLIIATLIINIAKPAITTLIVAIIATPLKLIYNSVYKGGKSNIASNIT
jgi:hypothetical protein